MIHEITLHHSTDMAHRVVGHDGKCARLHGHTYNWTVTVRASALGTPEFVIDFAHIKDVLNAWDHRTLLWTDDPFYVGNEDEDALDDEVAAGVVRLPVNPTSEQLSHLAAEMILERASKANAAILDVTVCCSETPKSSATATVQNAGANP